MQMEAEEEIPPLTRLQLLLAALRCASVMGKKGVAWCLERDVQLREEFVSNW